jgi:hypothetical protein
MFNNNRKESTMTTTTNQRPIADIRMGSIKAAVWRFENDNAPPRYTATFSRSYRDRDGNWHDTSSFDRDDVLVLTKIADRVHTTIHELQDNDRKVAKANAASTEAAEVAA